MASDSAHGVAVVDIGAQQLERHVRRAFEQAWTLSGGRPLGAAHLLRACIAIGGSEAFIALAKLLPLKVAAQQPMPDLPPFNLNAVALERPLADSFYVAESFFAASGSEVWGRDLVTLALLSRGDPSLHELASQAGTTISDLRAEWLQFVRQSGRHRTADDWDRWWRASGLTPASDTAAYLLTWNPSRYSESQMAEHLQRLDPDGYVTFGWSSGNNRSMSVGDRVFLLRQGRGRRGLVGVGTVSAAPREADHWDKVQRAEGRTSWLVQVRWEAIDVEPMVELSTLVADTGESGLWATQVGGVSIAPVVRERLEEMWPGAWERHRHNLDPVPATDLAPKHLIARFDADLGAATDSLNVQRYVDAFARIATSSALTPPLSVGIFGDWGSGKTFFMERIEAKIKQLAESDEGVEDDLFVHNVCQMRFNAWHFAETDLWASLVSTIFKELRRHLDPTDDTDEFNKLLNKLEIARALREQAETQLKQAKSTLQDAQAEVAKAKEALAELPAKPEPPTDDELRAILKENLKDLVDEPASTTKTLSGLFDEAYRLTGDEAFMTAHRRIDSGQATVEEANNLLVETRALVSRSGFWWRLLTTAKVHRTRAFWAVLVAAVVIPVAFVVIQSQVDFPVGWSAGLLEAFTVVGALVVWARSTLARAAPVFNALDRMQGKIERSIDDAQGALRRKYEEDRTEALQAEDAARRELANAQQSRDQAESELEAAQAALRESTSQARLGRFIRERATTPDYDKYLGLSAMIRRDFEELSDLMTPGPGPHDPTLPHIDRIILYIDDLDRCYPPTKVVRVLEAVHLLLFFPLFVVFVGVDSRWVSRALNRHYDHMLSDEALQVDGAGPTSARAPANSQDFLEKIFQVPFWLRRMDPPAVQRMIHRLISTREVEADHQLDVDQLGEGGDAPSLGDDHDATTAATPVESRKAGAQLVASEAEGYGETIGEPAAPPTEALRIRKAELDFMDQVAPLMPRTPRAVKRFVNIYRLYKAALSTPGLGKFLGSPENPGNFRAVQVLLALVIGTPDFAKAVVEVLDGVEESSGQRLSDLPTLLPEQTVPTWQTTLNALEAFAAEDNDLTLTSLREVSPLVTRYSLHHMVSVLPGESTLP